MEKKNTPLGVRRLATKILATFLDDFIKKEFKSAPAKGETVTGEIAIDLSKC